MSFYERYELLDIVKDGPVKTFRARKIQTGENVAVHLLIGSSVEPQTLINKVRNLTDPARKELVEFGEHQGTPYVVTKEWTRTHTFPEWVSSVAPAVDFAKAGNWRIPVSEFGRKMEPPSGGTPAPPEPLPPSPADPQPPAPEPPAPVAPGEFTRMFEAAQRNEPNSPAQGDQVGEFTRMFQAQGQRQQSSPEPQAPPPPPPPPPPPAQKEPGEFTRMFQIPATAPPPKHDDSLSQIFGSPAKADPSVLETVELPVMRPAPPPPAKQEPGEFTRMFQTPAAVVPPPLSAPPKQEPGEFTRMFQTPAASPPSQVSPFITPERSTREREAANDGPGEFTRMFDTSSTAPQAPTPPPAPKAAGPGEFTRFFQTPQQPSAPAPHPAYNEPLGRANENAAPAQGPGEFTRMFGTPVVSANPLPQASDPPGFVPMQPPPPRQDEPGEFTRMFSVPNQPMQSSTPPPAPRPALAPAAPAAVRSPAKQSYMPLFIGLGILLLLAIAVILIFALRKS